MVLAPSSVQKPGLKFAEEAGERPVSTEVVQTVQLLHAYVVGKH